MGQEQEREREREREEEEEEEAEEISVRASVAQIGRVAGGLGAQPMSRQQVGLTCAGQMARHSFGRPAGRAFISVSLLLQSPNGFSSLSLSLALLPSERMKKRATSNSELVARSLSIIRAAS